MADKRMFSKDVMRCDDFLDLSFSAQTLYMHMCLEADDDGFLNNIRSTMRITGTSQEDFQELIDSKFILQMGKNLIAISHWRIHNTIRKDRYKPTSYQSEFKKLKMIDNVYTLDKNGMEVPKEECTTTLYIVKKFDEFWKAYPRKEHKALTEQQYAILISQGISEDMLIASAKAYAKDKQDTEQRYLNCPDTWLKKGIYTDYEVKEEPKEEETEKVEDDEPEMNLWDGNGGED